MGIKTYYNVLVSLEQSGRNERTLKILTKRTLDSYYKMKNSFDSIEKSLGEGVKAGDREIS